MSAGPVQLAGLANGLVLQTQAVGGALAPLVARQVNVFLRGTTSPVNVYATSALTGSPLGQPLATDSNGNVPGYIAGEAPIDFVDVITGIRAQGEPVAAGDVARVGADGYIGTPGQGGTALSPSVENAIAATALNVLNFGAKGDRVTDDASAIQAAIDAGQTLGMPVRIPAAPAIGSNRGWYLCNSSLKYYSTSVIFGDGSASTELRFLNNSHGFEAQSKTTFSTFWRIKGLWLRGIADTSTVPTWTAGMWLGNAQDDQTDDIVIDRFVDGVVCDGTLSFAALRARGIEVITSGYPNMTNGYPRYLWHVLGSASLKPQVVDIEAKLYSLGTNSSTTATSSGSTGQMIGPISTAAGLWAESGIKVFALNSSTGNYARLTSGTDYRVHANSSGGAILTANAINVGGTRNSSPVTSVYVELLGTQANGVAIRVEYSDPWARKGLYIEEGTGNRFLGFVSGCETAVQLSDTGVFNTAFSADRNANANNNLRFATSYNTGTVSITLTTGAPSTGTTTSVASLSGNNYTVTVTLATDGSSNILATAQNVIDAVRADPTSYKLLDVRGQVFTTGSGPYPAAQQGSRSDNSGFVAALTTQLLAPANAGVAGPNDVNLLYHQVCNLGVKLGAGSGLARVVVGEKPLATVAQVVSYDSIDISGQAQKRKRTTMVGEGRAWLFNEKTGSQGISTTSFTTVTWDTLADSHSTSSYLYYDTEFGFGGREIQFEGDVEINSTTGQYDVQIQLQQSLDNGNTWTALKTAELKETSSLTSVTRRFPVVISYEDNTVLNPVDVNGMVALYRVQAKIPTGTSVTFFGNTDDVAFATHSRLKARDVNLAV